MPRRSNTRGANGNGTIRKRSDGRWEARYTSGIDPGTGKQIQKSVYGNTQKEVRIKLTQIANDIDQGVFTEPTKMTVGSWLDLWLKEYKADVKPNTIDQYDYQIRTHLKPAFGKINLQELTAPMIQKLYNTRSKPYKIKQNMCNGPFPKVHPEHSQRAARSTGQGTEARIRQDKCMRCRNAAENAEMRNAPGEGRGCRSVPEGDQRKPTGAAALCDGIHRAPPGRSDRANLGLY